MPYSDLMNSKTVWAVRAGRDGEREDECLTSGLTIAGWPEVNRPLPAGEGSNAIRRVLEDVYDDSSARLLGNWEGQLNRFVNEMSNGDYIIMPRKDGTIAIGTIEISDSDPKNGYQFRGNHPEGRQHVRKVHWIVSDIPRTDLSDDLRNSLRALLTIFRIDRPNIVSRIQTICDTRRDPGPDGITKTTVLEAGDRASASLTEHASLDNVDKPSQESDITRRAARTTSERRRVTVPVSRHMTQISGDDDSPGTVDPEDPVTLARTKMLAHDYSQLAVIKDGLLGVITLSSLALGGGVGEPNPKRHSHSEINGSSSADGLHVKNLMSTAPPIINAHADILSAVPVVEKHGFAFVQDEDSYGIVTIFDLMKFYQQSGDVLAKIQEIEETLQRALEERNFSDDQIKSVAKPRSLSSMTLGAYPHVFKEEHPPAVEDGGAKESDKKAAARKRRNEIRKRNWEQLDWNTLDREYIVQLIERVAGIRNDLAHWRARDVTADDRNVVDGLLRLVRLATHSSPATGDPEADDAMEADPRL